MRTFLRVTVAGWALWVMSFAGLSASDVTVPAEQTTGSDQELPLGAAPGTISLWFARPPAVEDKVLFVYGAAQRGCARGLWLVREDRVCFYFWGWPDDLHADVPGGIAASEWHHIAGTYDGSVARVYLDGKLLRSVKTKIDTRPGGKFYVGRNLVEDVRGKFPGEIAEVQIHDRALTTEEIRARFAKGAATRTPVKFPELELDVDVEEIVFAVRQADTDGHWYANFGVNVIDQERRYYHDGGRLCRLNVATGKVTTLLEDSTGGVRDPQVHYDGKKILFSYRRGGQPYYHLYEIGIDGKGLRQLTDGPYDDLEPTYLPDGGIIFCSSRCNRWVPCYFTQVAVLYRCDSGGGNIRKLSANTEHENTPWVLPDGRILFQRWEYVDRSQIGYHHLWTMNPDGSGQMVYFGNQKPDTVMIDAKPIPGTGQVVASFSPGHGRNEHAGVITVVDPRLGPDAQGMAKRISQGGSFRDPYPLSADRFLVAGTTEISVMDGRGNTRTIFRLPREWIHGRMMVHEPRPLRARPREVVLRSRTDRTRATGRVMLQDVYVGRNMDGVRRGDIKELLILEILPKPYNIFSGMEPLSYGGTFLLERIVGKVPVEPDGSAHMEVPALRPLFFVALDEDGNAVKRMQSFLTVQPGEQVSCVGCHEPRAQAPKVSAALAALQRPPSQVKPIADVPAVLDFPRDIQPILDRHCVACHDYDATETGGPRAGGIILAGDRGPMFSHSYFTLTISVQFVDGRNLRKSNYPPRSIGSSASPLLRKLDGDHYDARLTQREKKVLRLWIDTGAAYPGTYAAMGTGSIGHYLTGRLDRSDRHWPSMKAARAVLQKRCSSCHERPMNLPDSPSDNRGMVPWAEGRMNDLANRKSQIANPAFRFNRHIVYNVTRPEKSLLLLAPLAKEAGGYGTCDTDGVSVFTTADDPGYQTLLTAIREAKEHLHRIKRFDMPGFRPSEHYVREMQRYGILPAGLGPNDPVDPYETDRAYWASTWYRPTPVAALPSEAE